MAVHVQAKAFDDQPLVEGSTSPLMENNVSRVQYREEMGSKTRSIPAIYSPYERGGLLVTLGTGLLAGLAMLLTTSTLGTSAAPPISPRIVTRISAVPSRPSTWSG